MRGHHYHQFAGFLLLLLLSLAGCSRKDGQEGAGATVTIGINQNPNTLDPIRVVDVFSGMVAASLHSSLVLTDTNGEVVPILAESVRMSPDAKLCEISVKRGATFWDGSEITAKDVRFSIERLRSSPHPFRWIYDRILGVQAFDSKQSEHIAGIEILDEKRLNVRFAEPEPEFARFLGSGILTAIVKQSTNTISQPFDLQVTGAGPYKPGKFQPGVSFEMLGNKGFPKHQNIERFVYRVIENPQNQLEAIAKGEIDILRLRGPMLQEACIKDRSGSVLPGERFKNCEIITASGNELLFIMFNWSSAHLTNVPSLERRSFAESVRRELSPDSIATNLYWGQAESASGIVPPSVLPQQAQEIGERHQFKPGTKLRLTASNDPDSRRMAAHIQAQLQKAGVELENSYLEPGLLVQNVLGHQFETALFWIEAQVPSVSAWTMFFTPGPFSVLGESVAGVEERVSAARSTLDDGKRLQTYAQVAEQINRSQSAWVPVVSRKTVFLTQKNRCEGLFLDSNGAVFFHELRLKK